MIDNSFPSNLNGLHKEEESLRQKALTTIQSKPNLLMHLDLVERAMSVAKIVVDYPRNDEDFNVIKILSIRVFNAFGASQKLMLTGYHQNSGLIMRDILETLYLMDLFKTDRTKIKDWRLAGEKERRNYFSPVAVRKALDERDGLHTQKRAEIYKMFSELAAHPNIHSQHMLKSEKGGDILMGPFMEGTNLDAGIGELGKLAAQVGKVMNAFLPEEYDPEAVYESYKSIREKWIETFLK